MKYKNKELIPKYFDNTARNSRIISKKMSTNSRFTQKRPTASDPNCCNVRSNLESNSFRMHMNRKTMTYNTFYCRISRRSKTDKYLQNLAAEKTKMSELPRNPSKLNQELSIGDAINTCLTKNEKAPICIKMPSVTTPEGFLKEDEMTKTSRLENFDETEEENNLQSINLDFVEKAFNKIRNYLLSLLQQQKNFADTLTDKDEKLKEVKLHLRKVLKKNVTLRSELKTKSKFGEEMCSELYWKETELQKYEDLLLELQELFNNYAQANKKLLGDWQDTQDVIKNQKQEIKVKEAEIRELKEKVRTLTNEVQKQRDVSAETSRDLIETNHVLIEQKNLIVTLNAELQNARKSETEALVKIKQKEDEISSTSTKLSKANAKINAFYGELAQISDELNQRKEKDARLERVMKLALNYREELCKEENETEVSVSEEEEVGKYVKEIHRKEDEITGYYQRCHEEDFERKNLRKIFGYFVEQNNRENGSLTLEKAFGDWEDTVI